MQKGVEERDKAFGVAKEQIKDSTFTKSFASAKESAKKATQDTSSVVTGLFWWFCERKKRKSPLFSSFMGMLWL